MKPPCPAPPQAAARPATGPPMLRSDELLAGGKEVLIRHGAETYRLKLTSNNKLILIK